MAGRTSDPRWACPWSPGSPTLAILHMASGTTPTWQITLGLASSWSHQFQPRAMSSRPATLHTSKITAAIRWPQLRSKVFIWRRNQLNQQGFQYQNRHCFTAQATKNNQESQRHCVAENCYQTLLHGRETQLHPQDGSSGRRAWNSQAYTGEPLFTRDVSVWSQSLLTDGFRASKIR